MQDGNGKETRKNGDIYQGDYRNGLKHGKGKIIYYLKKDVFDGEFINGVFNGRGELTNANGDSYNGEFQNGERHGTGILKTKDFKYNGQFYKGKFDGQGEF